MVFQMEVLRQAKESAVKSCNDQKREVESLTEQLDVTRQKLVSTKQQLQVRGCKIFLLQTLRSVSNEVDLCLCSKWRCHGSVHKLC